jgi:hypothetical protein
VHTKAGLYHSSHALLKNIGTVSTSGSKGDMVRRLCDMREYAIAACELDGAAVYPPAASEEDFRVCVTCDQGGAQQLTTRCWSAWHCTKRRTTTCGAQASATCREVGCAHRELPFLCT